MLVASILATKGSAVHTIPVTHRVADAVRILTEHRIGAVVVLAQDGAIAGILSERDVVRLMYSDPAGALVRPVSDCMTRRVLTCTPDTTVAELMQQMTDRRVRHMPVVEGNTLVGIVSIGDVVKRKIEEAEAEAERLREYIAS